MSDDSTRAHRRPITLVALAVLLAAETVLLAGIAVWLLVELLTTRPNSLAGGLAIFALAAIAAVWLAVTTVNTLRARSWVRGAAVTWQVLQFAIGIGFFQGADARPALAWALIVPAVIGVVLALAPSVVAATARIRPED
jgi:hypothetical protein